MILPLSVPSISIVLHSWAPSLICLFYISLLSKCSPSDSKHPSIMQLSLLICQSRPIFFGLLCQTDYTFLEDTLRATESARRMRSTHGGCPAGTDRHPGFKMRMLGVLRKAAFRRKVCLFFLPAGMSKRERNQSRFNRRFLSFQLCLLVVTSLLISALHCCSDL